MLTSLTLAAGRTVNVASATYCSNLSKRAFVTKTEFLDVVNCGADRHQKNKHTVMPRSDYCMIRDWLQHYIKSTTNRTSGVWAYAHLFSVGLHLPFTRSTMPCPETLNVACYKMAEVFTKPHTHQLRSPTTGGRLSLTNVGGL